MRQFENMSLEVLISTRTELDALIKQKQAEAKSELLAEFKQKATDLGIDFNELVGGKASKTTGSKVPPKYRNPTKASQTWTGRGRTPTWIVELLETGKKLEELVIEQEQ